MHSHSDPLPHPPKRVLVAGVSGVGKATLAGRIAAVTGGSHTEIDALFHGPAWTPRPEFLADVRSLVLADSWTTEWQYDAARPLLAESADMLVWLDLPPAPAPSSVNCLVEPDQTPATRTIPRSAASFAMSRPAR